MAGVYGTCFETMNSNATQTREFWVGTNAAAYGGTDSGAGGIGSYIQLNESDSTQTPIADLATGLVLFRIQSSNIKNNNHVEVVQLYESTTPATQLSLSILQDGKLVITRGTYGSGTVLATSGAKRMREGLIYHVSWFFEIANSTTADRVLKVNGEDWITVSSGSDTQNSANAYVSSAYFSHANNIEGNVKIMDYIHLDTTGSKNNTHIGQPRMVPCYANAVGDATDFTGSDGNSVNNHELVDEVGVADDDTTYIESDTNGDRDCSNIESLHGTAATIYFVQLQSLTKHTDAGSRTYKNYARISSTNYDQAEKYPDATYAWEFDVLDDNPNTATAWTNSDIDSLQVGITVVS